MLDHVNPTRLSKRHQMSPYRNRNGDQKESIAKAAQELQCSANGTVYSSEWSNIDGLL